ncbi:MAG: sugar ABC transporter substrate-binding protein [Anaerolineae bacterium]|nr:sugar ABC transporter substrate-binding protein [Anaerolineae bacterium]
MGKANVGWALLLLVLSIFVPVFAGCARATPTPEPVMLSFAFPDWDTEHYRRMLQEFNELYPYITIELQPKKGDILGGIGAGNADAFVSSQFAQIWLKDQGNVLNLTPLVEQDNTFNASDFYPGAIDLYTSEGSIWGIPVGVDLMVMYYNQDLFDQAGVSYPQAGWTWDDFLAAAMSIRDPEADIFGYMGDYENFGPFDVLTFIYQHGGRIFDDLQDPTRTAFDDPLTIEALEWYVDLMFDYNVIPTSMQTREAFGSRGSLWRGVQLERLGMWTGMLSERKSDWMEGLRVGIAPLPVDRNPATLTLIEGYFISAQTEHPDACWTWISFLSQRIPLRSIPVRKSLTESSEFEQQVGRDIATVSRRSMENALMLSPELAEFEEALNVFTQAFESILQGQSTPLEAMTWAQQESQFK